MSVTYCYIGQDSRCVVGDPVGQDSRCVVGDPVGQDRCVVGDPVGQDRCVFGDAMWVVMLCQSHRSYQEEYRLCKADLIFSSPWKVQTKDPISSEISFNDTGIRLSQSVHNLGISQPDLSFKQHMLNVCQTHYTIW